MIDKEQGAKIGSLFLSPVDIFPHLGYNPFGKTITEEYIQEMCETANQFIHVSNLLLTCDYYSTLD